MSALLAAILVTVASVALLGGWLHGIAPTSLGISSPATVPSISVCFILLGSGLLIRLAQTDRVRSPLVAALAFVVALVAAIDIASLLAGNDYGIEELIFPQWDDASMSYATAFQFLLGSYCLAALSVPRIWNRAAFSRCATTALLVSLLAVVVNAFDAPALSEFVLFSGMSLHTSVSAVLLHLALLLKRPQASWINVLFERGVGSTSARRLLPLAILGPFLLCLATLALVRAGIFNDNFRLSLLAIAMTTLASTAVLRNAAILNRAERASRLDALTGLANRKRFSNELDKAISRAKEDQTKVGLVVFNLDRFKSINQVLGYASGDAVLRSIAGRLDEILTSKDIPARIAGDEFAVILADRRSSDDIQRDACRLRRSLMQPIVVNCGQIETSASIGVAVYPDDTTEPKALRRYADLALSAAKTRGRRATCYFDENLERAAQWRAQLETDLRRAIDRNEMVLHYQPLFDVNTRRIRCVEALVRWRHETRGMVPPDEFIPVAESSGLIRPLGRWILTEACVQQIHWQEHGIDLKVAVNVSAAETAYDDYADFLTTALDTDGLDANRIELEITESLLIEHESPSVKAFLNVCDSRGIGLAIDDFGTGYSSLSYLKRLPISTIKIDRSFVRELGRRDDDALVEALVSVGHSLGKRIVAEGIETEAQLEIMRRFGCHDVQGYLLSPALEAQAIEALLRNGHA